MSVGGGLIVLHFFWSLKKCTERFNFRSNELFRDILGPLGRHDRPWGKKRRIRHLYSGKKYKIPHFSK